MTSKRAVSWKTCSICRTWWGRDLWQALTALVEVAYFDQRRPQFDRTLDHADDIVHDPQQVLLEEVGLEPIEGLLQVGGEQPQRLGSRRTFLDLGGMHCSPVQGD